MRPANVFLIMELSNSRADAISGIDEKMQDILIQIEGDDDPKRKRFSNLEEE